MNKNIIGEKLKAQRENVGMSPQQLSDALRTYASHISAEEITAIENYQRTVYDFEVAALSTCLCCPVNALFEDYLSE